MENTSQNQISQENTENKPINISSTSTPIITTNSTAPATNLRPIKIEPLTKTSLKSSQEKSLRKQIVDCIPAIADLLDKIWPKKASLLYAKQRPYTTIYFVNEEPCFVEVKDEKIAPHLKLLHKYPFLLPTCQVDKGAIPFIISGANVMIPGMTSKGGILPEVKTGTNVAILCEGKETILAIGRTTMSKNEMIKINKGIGLEMVHYTGDDAWNSK